MAEGTNVKVSHPACEDVRPKQGFGRGRSISDHTGFTPGSVSPHITGGQLYRDDTDCISEMYAKGAEAPCTSTPLHHPDDPDSAFKHLGLLITELGRHIGDSVTARLMSSGEYMQPQGQNADTRSAQNTGLHSVPSPATVDLSRLSLVLKSDIREPPVYRGDGTDKCSVHEWVDLMVVFLRKRHIPAHEQSDELMSRLMGRAKDVVRIGLRSDPSLDVVQHPDTIYTILKQHFGDLSYSCMPLADFYNTLPRTHENPVDYWVRLNKAADIADECLQRQGKRMEDLSKEVAMMFVRNCPDPSLSVVFKSKLVDSWTAKDVQVRIDEYQRELKSRQSKTSVDHRTRQAVAVVGDVTQVESTGEAAEMPGVVLQTCKQNITLPQRNDVTSSMQNSIDKMADMLGKVLEQLSSQKQTTAVRRFNPQQRRTTPRQRACDICNNTSHTTISHCRIDRLCFTCHQPGHMRDQCPSSSHMPQPATAPASPRQLNLTAHI